MATVAPMERGGYHIFGGHCNAGSGKTKHELGLAINRAGAVYSAANACYKNL